MTGPEPAIVLGAAAAFVFLAAITASGTVLAAVAIAEGLRRRREARMLRTPEARLISATRACTSTASPPTTPRSRPGSPASMRSCVASRRAARHEDPR